MKVHKDKLDPTSYNIVRGEALAIRALLHFNLIQIYGPVPYNPNPAKAYLPYATTNDIAPYTYNTFDEFMGMVLDDMNEAEILLQESDPLVTFSSDDPTAFAANIQTRKRHVNYYGVLALQARIRHYLGLTDGEYGSVAYAKKVLALAIENTFRLTTAADFAADAIYADDRTYYSEHLAGIYCGIYDTYDRTQTDAFNSWNPDFGSYMGVTGTSDATDVDDIDEFLSMFTKNKGLPTTDIRFANNMIYYKYRGMAQGGPIYTTGKWMPFSSQKKSPRNFPIIRLAEIYFIVMEAGSLAEANQLYEEYCTARSIDYIALTEADREEILLAEFIREFYGESLNFFRYKRTGERRMFFSLDDASEESYILPIPEREAGMLSVN
jgi:hypothetical protein